MNDGSIFSQSPTAKAYINAIAELSGSVTGQACLVGAGCTDRAAGTVNLPTLKANLPILSIDPNNLNIVSTPFLLGGFSASQAAAFTIQVPSPGTLAVLTIGLAALGGATRRRRRQKPPVQALAA
ncbi:MAG: PEP-CTERM sorting domain-containing protein [Chromatiaceae bacterium]|nr:PEP-CTERM sorting domain-containing protein [Chromatiaceae bacterium]